MKFLIEAISKIKRRLHISRALFPFSYTLRRVYNLSGIEMQIYDTCYKGYCCAEHIVEGLKDDCYGLDKITFKEKDVIIDIGAHVGVISIYLAKKYPLIKIFAFEPTPKNYRNFIKNIRANDLTNINVFNKAVTCDGRILRLVGSHLSTGGMTACSHSVDKELPKTIYITTESVIFDNIIEIYNIEKCRLLKIDCEGCEYEILFNTKYLSRIEYLSGEFHSNGLLMRKGYSPEGLLAHCRRQILPKNIFVKCIHMAE